MPIKRLTVNSVLAVALFASAPLLASPSQNQVSPVVASVAPSLQNQLSIFAPAPVLSQSVLPVAPAPALADNGPAGIGEAEMANAGDLRKTLIGLAMKLRDIRYVRGGRDPSTGFDCSGFVRYVFAHAVGMDLPANSASQFLSGLKVNRGEMKPGDLVFFRTAGRRGQGRVSHVGIYIANGQFIHSPSRGKTVRVDSLEESYWAKRFAGAKRPEAMVKNG